MLARRTLLLLFFISVYISTIAQTDQEEKIPKRLSELVKDAEDALFRFDGKEAEALYLKILKRNLIMLLQ